LKKGFKYRPTSFYSRPLWVEKYASKQKDVKKCFNGRPIYKGSFNNIEIFIKRMNEIEDNSKLPYFFFNFLTEYTHDDFVVPSYVDRYFRDMLERFERNGYLDNTLLIVFSDHGSRLVQYSYQTEAGNLEKNLPFISMRLPKSLWGTIYHQNAKSNRNRLVNAFDVYQTLRHFLHINANYSKEMDRKQFSINDKNTRYLRGISLFEKIPVNRSCSDVLIPDEYCSCFKESSIAEKDFKNRTNLSFKTVTNFIQKHINSLTKDVRNKCVLYKLQKLHRVSNLNSQDLFQFIVISDPGDAWFQTVVKFNKKKTKQKEILSIYGKVIRISPYGKQSYCISDSFLRNYCYCKEPYKKFSS
jgi:hypothetical protein